MSLGIELPEEFPGFGIECEDAAGVIGDIEDAVGDRGVEIERSIPLKSKPPCR